MNIVERAKKICLSPDSEWSTIAGERTETSALIVGYVLPLAGVAAIAQFIGASIVGRSFGVVGTYRVPLITGLGLAVASLVVAVVGILLLAILIDALAPTFGAQKNREQATKLAVYSATPVWLAGVLQILPAIGVVALLGALYAIYLLYLGLPRLMKCPAEKSLGYTATVIVCAFVIMLVGSLVTTRIPGVVATVLFR